jgi:hypothetical protein
MLNECLTCNIGFDSPESLTNHLVRRHSGKQESGPLYPRMSEAEYAVREYAKAFPTPNVLAALGHCESGRLEWSAVAALFTRATASALYDAGTRPDYFDKGV